MILHDSSTHKACAYRSLFKLGRMMKVMKDTVQLESSAKASLLHPRPSLTWLSQHDREPDRVAR